MTGGVRVVIAHSDLLVSRGHDVVVVAKGVRPAWRATAAAWRCVASFDEISGDAFDFVVGTFWTTLESTYRLAGAERGVHLCQGFEGAFTAYQAIRARIEEAYRLPIPKITVSPHLVEVCRTFNEDSECVGQVVDPEFFQSPASANRSLARVLLMGPWQVDFKGIDVGYKAIQRARESGAKFEFVRVSQWEPHPDEPTALADEFHVGLTTSEVAHLMRNIDLLVGPSRTAEGFGLPAAEGMASGIPAVLTRIPSFLSWNESADFAAFVDEDDWRGMGDAITTLLGDADLRRSLAKKGRATVQQFEGANVGERLDRYFHRRKSSRMRAG